MKTLTATHARKGLYRLISEVEDTSEPVLITGRAASAVLVAERDWRALEETVYLLSVPGMRESIRDGMAEAVEDCDEALDW